MAEHACSCLARGFQPGFLLLLKLHLPAQVNSTRLQTMEVIVVRAKTLAELAVNGALCVIAMMVGVWDVTKTVTPSEPWYTSGRKREETTDLGIRHCPSQENVHPSNKRTLVRLQGWKSHKYLHNGVKKYHKPSRIHEWMRNTCDLHLHGQPSMKLRFYLQCCTR